MEAVKLLPDIQVPQDYTIYSLCVDTVDSDSTIFLWTCMEGKYAQDRRVRLAAKFLIMAPDGSMGSPSLQSIKVNQGSCRNRSDGSAKHSKECSHKQS